MSDTDTDTTDTEERDDQTTDADQSTEDAAQQSEGDKGENDGTDWKSQARKWERQAKANADKAKRLDEIEATNQTEAQKLQAERDQFAAKANAATQRAVTAEIRATAANLKFRDPADAQRLLDLADLTDDEGEVDAEAIQKALKKIAKDKPYLLGSETSSRSGGDFSGGTGDKSEPQSVDDFRKARGKWRSGTP